ncbi:MAG: nucleotidyltransferase domain-containing protein [Deltaproteobacteria bacterium]|nr:nucleotidyltransferase domain-containing protein [Deltaproteobacteria bacterium]MBW1940855.1 nucleotidyltransferase domain-containing protein [Deltaproteobacteria bacterium]MBW2099860.1 nucleotidyltransferase domain-containing protein [Deltaproteobacteria bacterium]
MSFGSVNTNKFGINSDIDILVKFGDSEANDLFERYFGLKEQLEELFKMPVELVIEKDFKNPYFRESVNKTKRVIYEA